MLRHVGAKRTPEHNIRLAVLLCLTAGFVNAAGFLAFDVLTTNVTGHAALFAENLAAQQWQTARMVALWMLLFFAGAFLSSFIVIITGRNRRFSYVLPILIELAILLLTCFYGGLYDGSMLAKDVFAGSLLFAMGSQNALVSMISGSVVRTTHLTGMFTDLGIELAQIMGKNLENRSRINAQIRLRLVIISFFILGAVAGAFGFNSYGFMSFLIPSLLLILALVYDSLRIKTVRFYRSKTSAARRED